MTSRAVTPAPEAEAEPGVGAQHGASGDDGPVSLEHEDLVRTDAVLGEVEDDAFARPDGLGERARGAVRIAAGVGQQLDGQRSLRHVQRHELRVAAVVDPAGRERPP